MIIQRSILREMAGIFFFILIVTTLVFLVGSAFQLFKKMEGLGMGFLFRTIPAILGYVLPYTVMVAAAASSTLVYARLAAQNELTAMQVSGIPVRKALAPAILVGILLCILTFWLNDSLVPYAHYSRRGMIRASVLEFLRNPPAGESSFTLENTKIAYGGYGDGEFRSVFVTVLEQGKLRQKLHAKRGRIDFVPDPPVFILNDCQAATFSVRSDGDATKENLTVEDTWFQELPIPLKFGDLFNKEKRPGDMTSDEIRDYLRSGNAPEERLGDLWTELYSRYARSLAPLLLVMVCVSIGVMVRRGSRLAGLGASLPPLVVYFLVSMLGEGMGGRGGVHPAFGAFLGDIVLAAMAAVMFIPAVRR